MLNKDMCIKCWNKSSADIDYIDYWNDFDEERWSLGQLVCRGRVEIIGRIKHDSCVIFTKDSPPKECLYRLEYLLKEKEQDV